MQLIWTARFNKSMEFIFTCALDFYSRDTLKSLNTNLKKQEALLIANPKIGSKEPLLENRDIEYRHLIIKPYFKVIYTLSEDNIYMMDIWGTRRDPSSLTKGFS